MKSAAVIGCGKRQPGMEGFAIGHSHAEAYLRAFPDIRLLGVDISPDNLKAFGERFELPDDQLFESTEAMYAAGVPDAVSVCTWPSLHHPQVVEAAKQQVKAITCEKPIALDGSQIDEMENACKRNGSRLAIAHQRRYGSGFTKARELIAEGVIGENVVVHGRVGDGWDILSWTTHWFDMANYLLSDLPVSVLAGVDHTGSRRYQHAVEDASVIFVEYSRGSQAVFITGPDAKPFGINIYAVGSEGLLRVRNTGVEVMRADGLAVHEADNTFVQGYVGLFTELWEGVLDPSKDVRCGIEHAAISTRLAYAAHESARTMRRVELPPRDLRFAPLEIEQHPSTNKIPLQKVVLLADAHHADPETGEGGREGVADALSAVVTGSVHVVHADKQELTADDLADAELLVLYHTQRKSSEATRALIGQWVESGKPMLVAHCGIGAYADWPDFRAWLGRYWVWGNEDFPPSGHPHVACDLIATDRSAFDPGFDTAWLPRDEVYIQLATVGEVDDFVTATYPDGEEAVAWQAKGTPNVMVWAPGHRRDVWTLPVMREGVRACIEHLCKAASSS